MTEFFASMGGFERALWYMAIPSSLVFVISMVLTFISDFDAESDVDADGDGHIDFQFFTFKNFIYFFATFSWTGIVCLGENMGKELTLVISSLAGVGMMLLMSTLFYWMHRMSENRAIKLEDSIGKTGTVDLKIPAKGQGSGKISVIMGGALRNVDAISDGKEFPRGERVKIVKVENNELIVNEVN